VDLADFDGETRYAEYTDFTIASASENYRLSLTGYSGDAGWLIFNAIYRHTCRKDSLCHRLRKVLKNGNKTNFRPLPSLSGLKSV